jgi:hypothetical protein
LNPEIPLKKNHSLALKQVKDKSSYMAVNGFLRKLLRCGDGSAPQRFTLLDLLQNDFHLWRSASLLAVLKGEVSYLTGQGCSATPQMDFLRDHNYWQERRTTEMLHKMPEVNQAEFRKRNM